MKAARIYKPEEMLRIEEIEKPKLDKGTAVVKVRAAGVCATELDFLEGIFPFGPEPLVLGHEIAGVIDEIDPEGSGFRKKDRVVVYNVMNCGKCFYCRNGMENTCPYRKGQIGFTHNGGFEEFVQVPVSSLVALPKEVSFEEGAVLSCSGMTAVHSSRVAGTTAGDTVLVNGIGGVGLMCIQVAKIFGAHVIAVADSAEKAELAKRVGADETLVVTDYGKLDEEVRKLTGNRGVDVYYELVGTKGTLKAGIECLGIGGRLLIIGYQKEQNLDFYPVDLLIKEGKVVTSVAGCKRDLELALRFASEKRANPIIENRYPLERINEALQRIIDRKVKGRSVIVMD